MPKHWVWFCQLDVVGVGDLFKAFHSLDNFSYVFMLCWLLKKNSWT